MKEQVYDYDHALLISVWDDWQRRWKAFELPWPPSEETWVRPRPTLKSPAKPPRKKKKKKPYIPPEMRHQGYQNWSPEVERNYIKYDVLPPVKDWKGRPAVRIIPVPGRPGLYRCEDPI